MKKLKAQVFLRAARTIRNDLKNGVGTPCCGAIDEALDELDQILYSLSSSPEFKFFKKYYGKGKSRGAYWFGEVYNQNRANPTNVNIANQKARIAALMNTYKLAVKHNAFGNKKNKK